MIHHPGAQPYGYVPTLVTRGVDQFCLAGMVWFWKALKLLLSFSLPPYGRVASIKNEFHQ
jgi:hypothetical protein